VRGEKEQTLAEEGKIYMKIAIAFLQVRKIISTQKGRGG